MQTTDAGTYKEVLFFNGKPIPTNGPHDHQRHHITCRTGGPNGVSERTHRGDANVIEQRHHARLQATEQKQTNRDIDRWPEKRMPFRKSLESKPEDALHDGNSHSRHELRSLRILGPSFVFCKPKQKISGTCSDRNQTSHHTRGRGRQCLSKMCLQWKGTEAER